MRYLLLLAVLPFVQPAFADEGEISPEKVTGVLVSNRDINRVHCAAPVESAEWSKEKPVRVSVAGNDVFVKFLLRRENGVDSPVTVPLDLHVICGGEVYTLILRPRDQDTTTVRLGSSTRRELQQIVKEWGALPVEEKVKKLTLAVYRNDIPASFQRTLIQPGDPRYTKKIFKDVEVVGRQEVVARGTGLVAVEYALVAHKAVKFDERDFLSRDFGDVVGITVQPLTVDKDGVARLIIVERSATNGT